MEGCQPPIKGEGEGKWEGRGKGSGRGRGVGGGVGGGRGGPTTFATCCTSHENKIHSIIIAAFTIS